MRVAVVGHVEWIRFARVESMPAAGDIAHSTEDWEQAGGGGAVAAPQRGLLFGQVGAKHLRVGGLAAGRRVADQRALHHAPGMEHLAGLLHRGRGHEGPPVRPDGDDALGGERAQGRAHDGAAHPEGLAEVVLRELGSGRQALLEDGGGDRAHDGAGAVGPGSDVGADVNR